MKSSIKPFAAAIGASLLATTLAPLANAGANPFAVSELQSGYQLADSHGAPEGKCGEGKCGEGKCGDKADDKGDDKAAAGEGKCGDKMPEGKCGDKTPKTPEGKCGEPKPAG